MKTLDSDRKIYFSIYVNICKGNKPVIKQIDQSNRRQIGEKSVKEKRNKWKTQNVRDNSKFV